MKKHILLIIIVVILGALPLFIQYGAYIHCTDFSKQQLPFIIETKRMLSSGIPFWSWNTYYGDNFWASYGFYTLTSPFVWINCFFPNRFMLHAIFLTLILKYICAFLSSSLFLRKIEISKDNAMVGGLLYAFSSFAVSNSFYYHFFEPLIVFPFLLHAIERYLRNERYADTYLLLISFFTVFINYYFSVCSFIAAAMYVFVRICFSPLRIGFLRIAKGMALVLAGIALDSFILLPTALQLIGGPRTSGGILTGLDFTAFPFFIERLRVLFMPQVIEQSTSLFNLTAFNSNSVCLPAFGMLAVIIYVWHHKLHWHSILVILSLLAFLTPANTVFSLCINPNYTRWAYALCLFLIIPTVKLLDENEESITPIKVILYSLIPFSIFALALYLGRNNMPYSGESRTVLILCYAIATAVSLLSLLYFSIQKTRNSLLAAISISAVSQMCLFHFTRSDWYFNIAGDNNKKHIIETYVTNNEIEDNNGDFIYRTACPGRYSNMPMFKNMPGITTSHSVQNNCIRRLINATDTTNTTLRISAEPNCNHRSFYALMSVRRYIDYSDPLITASSEDIKKKQTSHGVGYTIFENLDYIPMGFTYKTYIPENIIDSLNSIKPKKDIPLQLLANLSTPEKNIPVFSKYLKRGVLVSESSLDSIVSDRRETTASSFRGTTTGFTSVINLPQDNIVFYSVPADKGFTAYVDDKEKTIHEANLGLSAIVVPKGKHSIEFRFIPSGLKTGSLISLLMLLCTLTVFLMEKHKVKQENISL